MFWMPAHATDCLRRPLPSPPPPPSPRPPPPPPHPPQTPVSPFNIIKREFRPGLGFQNPRKTCVFVCSRKADCPVFVLDCLRLLPIALGLPADCPWPARVVLCKTASPRGPRSRRFPRRPGRNRSWDMCFCLLEEATRGQKQGDTAKQF